MSEPKLLKDILCEMALNPNEPMSKSLLKCPVIQAELLQQRKLESDNNGNKEIELTALEDWLDNQDVIQLLHVSARTLQTLRSNGTIAYSKVNGKIYYRRQDIQKLLAYNNTMYKLMNSYGKNR